MKSFFKKLAFVMAMAMVVSLAAPAAANAATALYAALQNGTEPVTSLKMTLGDEDIDLRFMGAPTGWRDLERGWKVTNGDAVTVDQNGVIKAVKAGTATVEFFMEGCESAVVTVEVVAPVTENYLGADQTSVREVVLAFNSSVANVKEENVELYRIFSSLDGDVEVFWPIDGFKTADKKMTISPFVQFGDGDHYRVKFGGESYDFTTVRPEVDEITHVVTTFGTNTAANNGEASVSNDETGVEVTVKLGYKLMFGNMDVTDLFREEVATEFVLVSPDPEGDSEELDDILFDSEGAIIFADKVPVVVKTLAVYETEDGDKEIPAPPVTITPAALPEYKFDKVVDWCLYSGSGKVDWNKKTVAAGEENWVVVLKVEDSYGDIYVTHPNAADASKNILFIGDTESRLADAGYWFQYYSTNTDTFLIEESGADYEYPVLTTYKKASNAVIYVALHQEVENKETTFVDNVYAFAFEIGAPKEFHSIHLSKTSVDIMADAEEVSLTKANVTITAKDQYNGNWVYDPAEGGVDPAYEVTCSDSKAKDGFNYVSSEKKVYLDGAILYEETGRTSLTFTVKETNTGVTNKFTVSLGKPNWKDRSIEYTKPNFVVGQLAQNTNEFVDVNGTLWQKYTILVDQSNGYDKLKLEANGVKLGFINNVDNKNEFAKNATITAYKTSSSQKIGFHDVSGYDVVTAQKWYEVTGQYAKGDRIVALLKDGKVVAPLTNGIYTVTTAANGKINVQLTAKDGDSMSYAKAGTYTLAIYTVTEVKTDGSFKYVTDDVDFKVEDNRTSVKLNERIAIVTDETSVSDNLAEIVIDAFSFTLGGKAWKCDESVISDVTYKTDGKYVIIRDVTFMIPVDGSKELTAGEDYYVQKVTGINMSVKLAE